MKVYLNICTFASSIWIVEYSEINKHHYESIDKHKLFTSIDDRDGWYRSGHFRSLIYWLDDVIAFPEVEDEAYGYIEDTEYDVDDGKGLDIDLLCEDCEIM